MDSTETFRQAFRDLCRDLLDSGALDIDALRMLRGEANPAASLSWVARQGRSVLVVDTSGGQAYPAFQFTAAGDLRPELASHVATLQDAGLSPWMTWAWLTLPATLLSGQVPAEVLLTNPRRGAVAVQRYAENVRQESRR